MASPSAEYLVSLQDGRVKAAGTINEALKLDPKLFSEKAVDEGNVEIAKDIDVVEGTPDDAAADEKPPSKPAADGKLIMAEEKQEGRVSRRAIALLVNSLGGWGFWVSSKASFSVKKNGTRSSWRKMK